MGEHNLFNPGFVGQLVNIHARDAFYLSNLRASGAQARLPGLHTLRFNRRDSVCSLPWDSSEHRHPHAQVSQNSTYSQSCDIARQEDDRCLYSDSACATSGGGHNNNPDTEGTEKASVSMTADLTLGGSFDKYDEHLSLNLPSCRSAPGCSLLNEGHTSLASPGTHAALNGVSPGALRCPARAHTHTRRKRRPYSKPQLSQLEGEFLLNEFITRQRRRELSDRLHLTDQQVKIWFQNRRMKKKRLLMREQAFTYF